jgi:hypothetical protein
MVAEYILAFFAYSDGRILQPHVMQLVHDVSIGGGNRVGVKELAVHFLVHYVFVESVVRISWSQTRCVDC